MTSRLVSFIFFLVFSCSFLHLIRVLGKSEPVATVGHLPGGTDPEIGMDALQIIYHWGYYGEKHTVTTKDGYILDIHRIPYGKTGPGDGTAGHRPVIFMQHGLLCSSTNWITNLPHQSAGFIFADAGFDVWLGNFRGNTYGLKHKTLSTKDHKFWQFSWDEMAKYDLEAIIDYVLEVTGQSQLYYMGHSEGTLTAFAKFSSDIAFGTKWVVHMLGYDEFMPHTWLMNELAKYVCGSEFGNPLCDNILFLINGPNSKQLNLTRVPVYVAHSPAGTSAQNIVHFGQMVNSGKFQKYDYGSWIKNFWHYKQTTPPLYQVSKMQVPVVLFWGDLDWLADPQDIHSSVIPYLQNLVGNYEYPDFNHLDFIWGLSAAPDVYHKILNIINDENKI